MLSGFELRFEQGLRAKIREEMDSYVINLDSIPVTSPTAAAQFIEERAFFRAYQVVLEMMDDLCKELQEN